MRRKNEARKVEIEIARKKLGLKIGDFFQEIGLSKITLFYQYSVTAARSEFLKIPHQQSADIWPKFIRNEKLSQFQPTLETYSDETGRKVPALSFNPVEISALFITEKDVRKLGLSLSKKKDSAESKQSNTGIETVKINRENLKAAIFLINEALGEILTNQVPTTQNLPSILKIRKGTISLATEKLAALLSERAKDFPLINAKLKIRTAESHLREALKANRKK